VSILVIAPHPDDEAIGCGGTIANHVASDQRVDAVFLTSGELALQHMAREDACRLREQEAETAAAVLGIAELSFLRLRDWYVGSASEGPAAIAKVIERHAPETIYVPHSGDWHPDHRAAWKLASEAARSAGLSQGALLAYEVWTPLSDYNVVEDVGEVFARKLDAIRCYASQSDHFDYVRAATGIGQYRGALAGRCDYAEVFGSW
jgi:LmbE family N-acetylglucosaminyl deacetylase